MQEGRYIFQVTKHESAAQSEWKKWNWRSEGDMMLNGAFFTPSGAGASSSYARASSLGARSSTLVSTITAGAGALGCKKGARC
jgi:pectate lyase